MSSGGNTHWCYHCSRAIQPQGRSFSCPYCDQGFIEELPEVLGSNARRDFAFGSMEPFHDPRGLMDAFSEIMRHRMAGRDPNFDIRARPGMLTGRSGGSGSRPRVLIFHGQSAGAPGQDLFEFFFNTGVGRGRRPSDFGDFFSGPGLQELFEQLSMNERRGPPPAPRSAIDAMPTIRISQRHVNTDAHCPVCQDKFELGSKARQMPCEHIYHSNCIVPWLVEHNSCPVCRVELTSPGTGSSRPNPTRQNSNSGSPSGTSSHGGNSSSSDSHSRWNPFSFLWPSNSSN